MRVGTPARFATVLSAEEKKSRKTEQTLCTRCSGIGYKGRIGIYELLKVSKEISQAIKQQKSTQEIEDIAMGEGMVNLKQYGIKLIEKKYTTVSEVQKICND